MMKKLLFAFATAVIMFFGGQVSTAHADTTNGTEHVSIKRKVDVKKQRSLKHNKKDNQFDNVDAMFISTDFKNESANNDDIIASFSPRMNLTSNKHFKVPETDTIDGDGETTDPSKGYAMNHYTGDNVNGDAQENDYVQPKQGQMI